MVGIKRILFIGIMLLVLVSLVGFGSVTGTEEPTPTYVPETYFPTYDPDKPTTTPFPTYTPFLTYTPFPTYEKEPYPLPSDGPISIPTATIMTYPEPDKSQSVVEKIEGQTVINKVKIFVVKLTKLIRHIYNYVRKYYLFY